MELDEHFFRRESGRIVASLSRVFGLQNLALAEDVAQDAFCRALEVWKLRGLPDNPSAWLMTTAKNRAIDVVRRERTARTFAPELRRSAQSEWMLRPTVEELLGPSAIKDDQLRMMFSCCHPQLSEQSQVALVLNLVCGFSVNEVASAFLSGRAAMEKRIVRAKRVLAELDTLFDFADAEFATRLSAVQRALYLLFNEGYHGASEKAAVRTELCREAMRLGGLLLDHPVAATPETNALCALMCLHAARLPARLDAAGNLNPFFDQDRSLWDTKLIVAGERLLQLSAEGPAVTQYHIEAAIAAVHARARSVEQTDWATVISLYDALMCTQPSPVVALNRAIAVAQAEGAERGLDALRAIEDPERLAEYPFYAAAWGELELRCGRKNAAAEHFRRASALARNPMERQFFGSRVSACGDAAQPAQASATA